MSCMNKSFLVEYEENGKTDIESPTFFDAVKLWLVRFCMDAVDKVFLDRRKFMKTSPHLVDIVNTTRMENVFKFLAFLSVLVMKLVGFHLNLLLAFLTFPIWSFNLLIYPLQTLIRARGYVVKNLLRVLGISRIKLAYNRLGCGLLWSSYVLVMLLGLLVTGFVGSGIVMRSIIEKPAETREILNFDYTKTSPVAYVPISGLPNNHKLNLLVSLTVPESDYNRQLGVFQVRVEMVAASGEVTGNSSKACIVEFRSQAIRILKTMIKSAPLVAGFTSEYQILKIKMKMKEQHQETTFVKVMIESRAEYRSKGGADTGTGIGIPEIYEASMSLHSHIPLFKTLLWNWRMTLFIWLSFFMFFTQFIFFIMLFFRGIPKTTCSTSSSLIH